MTNLFIIIAFNLFLYFLFYKLISQKWIPNKNTIIAIIIGSFLVPLVLPIQKFIQKIIFVNELQILAWASIEEVFKLIPIVLLLYFCKSRKFTFLEILGIGIGFSFLETIMFSHSGIMHGSNLYPGLASSLYESFFTPMLRFLGALILHTFTVGLMSLTLIYLKNKRKLFILITLPISIYIHYLFNKFITNNTDDFLIIFLINGILFVLMFSIYILIKSKIENFDKIKTSVLKITKFVLKSIGFFGLYLVLFAMFINLAPSLGLQRYSFQEIEQTKISQDKTREVAKTWQNDKATNDIERIREIYEEIDNNYLRIIELMEENEEELSENDVEFLTSDQIPLRVELVNLQNKLFIKNYEENIAKMTQIRKDLTDSFKGKNLNNNLKNDYLAYMEISKQIIDTNKLIIAKKKLGEGLSEEEINYIDYKSNEKMSELNKIMDRLNSYTGN